MASTVFVVVVLIRFFLPLLIPKFPLPAILGCLVIDAADQTIFQAFTDDPLPGYQTYDKALDVYYLAIAYFSTMRNWRDPMAFEVARFLYIYRLIGVTLFELLGQRWLLLVFANTFEYFFIAYEAVRTRWNPLRLSTTAVVTMAAFIWIFIKLPQEWWIHVAQLDFTEFMADYPFMWIVLFALVAIAGTLIWVNRRRIPAADWPFTMAVDTHLPPVHDELTGHERFFTTVLLEKVLILALISVIFAQVLPDVSSSDLGLALGVGVLVVSNAAVSQWLRRRGRTWTTTGTEFVAMLAINIGLVFIESVFGSNRGANTPRLNTLFFVVLLSLLIALFDRYRATRGPRVDRPGVWATFRAEREAEARPRIDGMTNLYLAEHDAFINFTVIPGDGPTHVYLPGLICPASATLLEVAVHPRLTDKPAILVDYLGCGLSDRPANFSHTMRDHASTVAAVLDHVGARETVIIGHSMGGTVGLFLALDRPDLVAQLVLAESNLLPGGGDGTRRIAAFSEQQWVDDAAPAELRGLRLAATSGNAAAADYLAIRQWGSDARAVHAASVDIVGLDPSTQQRFLDLQIPRAFLYGQRTLDELSGRWTPDVPDRALLEQHGVATFVIPEAAHSMFADNLDSSVDAVVRATST